MKFFIVALALVACAYADVSELGYNYQQPAPVAPAPERSYIPPSPVVPKIEEPINTYIPPAPIAPSHQPIAPAEEIEQIPEDGYRYKTVRRVVYRHRA